VDPEKFTINSEVTPPKHAGRLIMTDAMVYVPLEGLIDMDVERDRVQKQITENENLIVKIRGKLAGEFSKRAPVDVVDQERQKLQEYESKAAQLKDQLEILK
jgi:valyl-tRNA synthetase